MARNLRFFLNTEIFGVNYLRRLVLQPIRSYSATAPKKPEGVAPTYLKRDHEFRMTKKGTIETLQQLLQLKPFDALNVVTDCKHFKKISRATLKNNYKIYIQNGITNETLLKYPEVLTVLDTEQKLELIKKLEYDLNEVVVLVLLSVPSLIKFVQSELEMDNLNSRRIATLSTLLQVFICIIPK